MVKQAGAAAPAYDTASETRTRLRLAAGCLLLIGLAFIQAPGLQVADTKFDLVADPASFLARAAHLWDPDGAMGQLQNQAYGYFWPMGPFFLLGDLLGLDGWVVQRLWMAVVLCVAFVGAARLARALGIRSDAAAIIAAFAYATSPRMLSTIGPISIEAWPSAVAPWVLVALVIGSHRGSPRRAAALAGLGVAMVGGVNAAATFAVIPLGVVWLLTRTAGPRRRSMMLWWPIFTLVGTLWWLVPLFVMGAYSPPFLGFIESASVTTFPTTVFDALRGTSDWVPYVDPSWQGGYEAITRNYVALNSGLVLLLGTVGIAMRRNPHRQFLFLSMVLGLFMVTMGHQGAVQGWFAESVRGSLDGALAPIRNVHKFDPVVRLPMILGLAWALEVVSAESVRRRIDPGLRGFSYASRTPVLALAVIAVLGAAMPALAGRLAPTPGVAATPGYWAQAAAWLEEQPGDHVALLAPGSSFGEYLWGTPRDEPMQYLGTSRWAVRNAIPLTPPGNIRMLDAIEERFNEGVGSEGLSRYLARSGIRYVVVRNDLRPSGDVPDPVLVARALKDSPGIELVQGLGPRVGGEPYVEADSRRVLVNSGWESERWAIEIYEVTEPVDETVATSLVPTVVGGPEDVLRLLDHQLVGDGPTELAADRAEQPESNGSGGPVVLTDGMADRERFFGRVHDGASAVRGPGDVRRSGNPVLDYELPGGARWRTTARLTGATGISASSSMSDADAAGGAEHGALPFAAVDGDPETSWTSGRDDSDPDWWRVDLTEPTRLGTVVITPGASVPQGTELSVRTEQGTSTVRVTGPEPIEVAVGEGTTSWLRVSETTASGSRLELSDVAWDGRDVHRQLVTPSIPAQWGPPDAVLLSALRDRRTGCVVIEGRVPCTRDQVGSSEELGSMERVVTSPDARSYTSTLTAVPRAGAALNALIQQRNVVAVTGSTTGVPDARASGIAAFDGDLGTTWVADVDDLRPTLSVNLARGRTLRGITVAVASAAPVRRPTSVTLVWPGGRQELELDEDGHADFAPIRTREVQIRVTDTVDAISIDRAGLGSALPVGVSELRLDGVAAGAAQPSRTVESFDCGSGPTLAVNGSLRTTRLVASPAQLFSMQPVEVAPCGVGRARDLDLVAGENVVTVAGTDALAPDALVLRSAGSSVGAAEPAAADAVTSPDSATFLPDSGSSVLAWRQNVNDGWRAWQGDEELEPVVVDGWQQGWRLDGDHAVDAIFAPDSSYRIGLGIGAGLLLCLVVGLVVLRRRPTSLLPTIEPRDVSPHLLALIGLLGGGLLGGWGGLAAAVIGAVLALALRRHDALAWMIGVLPALAAGAYYVRPWGSGSGWAGDWSWPHYLVLMAVGALSVVAGSTMRLALPRSFSRMKGISTKR
ncbi:DUF3367 domain-containing protein [Nocardioides sp. JQ2195]|uniref:alpha-(1->3)-arabinofuranosyltransferase n=1 Tax=Nocardioides sp. JQ2195 TaxID=2592334 RepID=UPI00143EE5F2|nr:alpha-(1->3)-arabinofuranosyltransferase [Nocardioides sp. JQ2195]QIX26416.1 DUF3367 domain-containing protein [Nocardioides sp. JQ2195]